METGEAAILRQKGIHPSAQRVAVSRYVLTTCDHPTADEVWNRVRKKFPMVSRATVYNTLNLLVSKGLLRQFVLSGGRLVFDSNVLNHHHFIEVDTGKIHDVPWDSLRVENVERLSEFEVAEYQVVLRGRRKKKGNRSDPTSEEKEPKS
jgi:Fe2+ or Zn2+ uptake regulation protein